MCLCSVSPPHGSMGCSVICDCGISWPQGYKNVFMLNSTEHEIYTLFALNLLDVAFIMLNNVKISTIVGILTFMSRINFVHS